MEHLLNWLGGDHAFWIFWISVMLLVDIPAVIHVLINKRRQPISALLWIFLILDFHLLGVLAYLLVGIDRISWAGIKYDISDRRLREADQKSAFFKHLQERSAFIAGRSSASEHSIMLDRLMPNTIPLDGNAVELLNDGTTAYPQMLAAIHSARQNIHLQSYIIMDDKEGIRIFRSLRRKARQGVDVKVLFDRVGSGKAFSSHFFHFWQKGLPNFQIHAFSAFNLLAPWRIQLRNHRKLLVVDGKVAFVGGINISEDNDEKIMHGRQIHDLHARIEGPAVGEFQHCFMRDWSFVTGTNPDDMLHSKACFPAPERMGESIVRVCHSGPGQNHEGTERLFLTAAHAARVSLWIVTPYFVPDKPFVKALCMAAARRVDVRVVIPRNNNLWYVRYACRAYYQELLEAGVRIFEKKGAFSHVKAILIDSTWAVMGSSNCDNRSFRLNYELDFMVEGGDFIPQLRGQLAEEISESDEILLPIARTFSDELLEGFCSLFTPIL